MRFGVDKYPNYITSLCFPTLLNASFSSWVISSIFRVLTTVCRLITPKSIISAPDTSLSFRILSSGFSSSTWISHKHNCFPTPSSTPLHLPFPSMLTFHRPLSENGSVMCNVNPNKLNYIDLVSNSIVTQYSNVIGKCVSEVCLNMFTIADVRSTWEDQFRAERSTLTFLIKYVASFAFSLTVWNFITILSKCW